MSKEEEEPHLRHMFTQFVAKRGIPPSRGAPPLPPGRSALPGGRSAFPPLPSPLPQPPQPPSSSSALRRATSHHVGSSNSTTTSNSSSYPARPQERRRSRPAPPSDIPVSKPYYPFPPSPSDAAYQSSVSKSPGSLTRAHSSHAPAPTSSRSRAPVPAALNADKTFPCLDCSSTFAQRGQLSRHVKRVHEKLRPFACEICGRLFGARSDRTRHVTIVHKEGRLEGGRDR